MLRLLPRAVVAMCLAACLGCSRRSPPSRGAAPSFRIEPPQGAQGAAEVVRIHVTGVGAATNGILLLSGAIDSYHSARIRSSVLPSTLEERLVQGTAWRASPSEPAAQSEWVFAPAQRLSPGETYGVGVLGVGALGSFTVHARPADYVARLWPPSFAPYGGKRWVFCGAGPPMPGPGTVVDLEPAAVSAVVAAGADSFETQSDQCFRLEAMDASLASDGGEDAALPVFVDASSGSAMGIDAALGVAAAPPATRRVAVAPPELDGIALDPSPVVMDAPEVGGASAACDDGAVELGPGCARVLDDRVFVRNGASPLLWVLSGPTSAVVVAARPGEELMLGGLTPGARVSLRGTATDLTGAETVFSAAITMHPPEPHLVLNEVLANPIGADRTSEWVELVNDGTTEVDTSGWSLEDSTRGAPLPRGTLAPGAYALVVPEGYDPGSVADVPPAEGTLILRVQALGGDGLSNQGEALRLRDPNGAVVSQFPALAATKAGVSMARRAPTSADDDATAFGASAPPGASPGAPNRLVEP